MRKKLVLALLLLVVASPAVAGDAGEDMLLPVYQAGQAKSIQQTADVDAVGAIDRAVDQCASDSCNMPANPHLKVRQ